jgi:hypothetical protein
LEFEFWNLIFAIEVLEFGISILEFIFIAIKVFGISILDFFYNILM